jgi:3',5'-cyclic AMP phosphodiesterase CpdA
VDWILDNKQRHRAEVVAISGDVVDDGEDWQFQLAAELIRKLRQADYLVLTAPGNHDYGPDGFRENPQSQKWFHDFLSGVEEYPAVFTHKGQAFILLDSMREEMRQIDLWGAQGYLGIDQLQKLDRILDELGNNPAVENIIIILHHHPFDYLFYHGLRDHDDLKGVIARRTGEPPRVNAILFGHKHLDHRFNDPDENKEKLYGIDLIYASGQSVERDEDGKMIIPVLDLETKSIQRFRIP